MNHRQRIVLCLGLLAFLLVGTDYLLRFTDRIYRPSHVLVGWVMVAVATGVGLTLTKTALSK